MIGRPCRTSSGTFREEVYSDVLDFVDETNAAELF